MRRMIVVAALAMTACAGGDPMSCDPGPWPSAAGEWNITIPGVCTGTMTVTEGDLPGTPCSRSITAEWSCGTMRGTECQPQACDPSQWCWRPFRYDDYMELALCAETGERYTYTGTVGDFTAYDRGSSALIATR